MQGEESNEFTNTLGEKIKVRICDTQEETSALLCKVLDGRKVAADLLAKEAHALYSTDTGIPGEFNKTSASALPDYFVETCQDLEKIPDDDAKTFDVSDFAIWIDPIGKFLVSYQKAINVLSDR